MNFLARLHKRRVRRKIDKYCQRLGHEIGWAIEDSEVQKLYNLDTEEMIDVLTTKVLTLKNIIANMLASLPHKCCKHGIEYIDKDVRLQLLNCDTGSVLVFRGMLTGSIHSAVLEYRGVRWCSWKEIDKVEISLDECNKLIERLVQTRDNIKDRVWAVRLLNWTMGTVFNVKERLDDWIVKIPKEEEKK